MVENIKMNMLLIDVGNTAIKTAVVKVGEKALDERALGERALDERALGESRLDQAIFSQASTASSETKLNDWWRTTIAPHSIGRVVACCVAGQAVRDRLQALSSLPIEWLDGRTLLHSLRNDYATPATQGADRWLGAAGAAQHSALQQQSFVLATFGTATTIDYVQWDGASRLHVFMGGVIIAGLSTALRSVSQATAQLPNLQNHGQTHLQTHLPTHPNAQPDEPLANTTTAALIQGAYHAQSGAVNSVLSQQAGAKLVIAGGAADAMQAWLPQSLLLSHTVLQGLLHATVSRVG